ncbi:MAG: deacylase [Allomuricauda sp.]|nr:MAG: deacylase [Allomuricauda sp.]
MCGDSLSSQNAKTLNKRVLLWLVFLIALYLNCSAQSDTPTKEEQFWRVGLALGKTFEANTDFPDRNLFSDIELSLGKTNISSDKEWAYRLRYPTTGVSLSLSDYGNTNEIGQSLSLNPFIELDVSRKLRFRMGSGIGYFNKQFDLVENPFNKGITTKLNLSFKALMHYDLYSNNSLTLSSGIGLAHYSNGHNRLPNQGLNTLLFQLSTAFNAKTIDQKKERTLQMRDEFEKSKHYFVSIRSGIGQNVLSQIFNDKKEVYSFAISAGKIVNKTFKLGIGAHYRFYEHYYDYINNNEALVQDRFPEFRDAPYRYATNFGVFASGELLLSHVGLEFDIGLNIYKPAYQIDWILNEGFTTSTGGDDPELIVTLGELDDYFKIKRTIPTRVGLKFYLISNNKIPKHNLYLGAHINANLGQADFTELSLGYVRRFGL